MKRTLARILPPLLLTAVPAMAQFTSYTVPGSLAEERLSAHDLVTRAYQDARWQVGFLHLDPRLAITDLGYISNIYSSKEGETESDFKAQGAAGLRGFFNLGPKVLVSPFVDFNYTWWQDQADLRSFNNSFGMQLFGDFNRLQLQLQGGRIESQQNLSSELQVPVDKQIDRLEAGLDIDFWGPFRFFAGATRSDTRHTGQAAEQRLPGLDLSQLDMETELLNAGIAYEFGNGSSIGLGFERIDSVFPEDPDGRSNNGSGPMLRIDHKGARLSFDLELAQRDLEFDARMSSDTRDQLVGVGRLSWQFTEKLTGTLYGASLLDPSALDSGAIFESRRNGVSLQRLASERLRILAFYEVGDDEFATVTNDQVTRLDDFTSYGINFAFELGERLTVELGLTDTRRDSTDPEFDRDLSAFTSRIRFGSNLLPW